MKKFFADFKDFIMRGNVLDLAVAVIIGGAFTNIVTSLTENFINPIIKFVTRSVAWYTWSDIAGFLSNFVSDVINFVILAFILFCIIRVVNKAMSLTKKKEEPAAPLTKICPFCKSEIDIDATRCPHCTSEQPEE